METTILLVDDCGPVRKALRCLLETDPDMHVVGDAANGWRALKLLRQFSPDVVITNISLPDINGIELTRQMTAECPALRVLILSMYHEECVKRESFEAGASAYLTKGCRPHDLVAAVRNTGRQELVSPGDTHPAPVLPPAE